MTKNGDDSKTWLLVIVLIGVAAYGGSQGWFSVVQPPPSGGGTPPANDTPVTPPAYHGYASCADWRIAEGKDYNGIAADSEACYQKAFDHCRYHEWGNPQDVFATDFVEPDCCIWECYN